MLELNSFFKDNFLEFEGKTFVICVSTGIDSSCLLDLFVKFRAIHNIKIVVAHVNHHKRAQSAQEAAYIELYCKNNQIPYYIRNLYFDDCKSNFQAEARNRRYKFFEEVEKEVLGDYLVLAHHADDNAETIIMKILRGSSLESYGGIKEVSKSDSNYLIIRPLLRYSRNEIKEYQEANNITYFEDESNSHDDYTRNRIRHEVIPTLVKESPDFYNKINEFGKLLNNASIVVDGVRDNYIKDNISYDNDEISFSKSKFLENSTFMQGEILFELLKKYNLSKANIDELLKVINSKNVNYEAYFKSLFYFVIEYDKVIITDKIKLKTEFNDIIIDKVGTYKINDKMAIIVEKIKDNYIHNCNSLCYNSNSLPLIVRTRRSGDKIKLKFGYKKVNDLFIDLKISKEIRDQIPLIVKDDEVLMVTGYKKSEILKDLKDNDILIYMKEI